MLFPRANPDPYRNSSITNTQFRLNGYSDIDRRWTDRGSLYISDLGDSYPGSVILKSTPTLLASTRGPDSIMDGQQGFGPRQCCGGTEEEQEEEQTCVEEVKDFLDSLPSPDEYGEWLLDEHGFIGYLCNYYRVTVWHYTVVTGTSIGIGPCFEIGCTGECITGAGIWCEKYVFANCEAAVAFTKGIEPQECNTHPTAEVGQPAIFSVNGYEKCDDYCEEHGLVLDLDRETPVAYTAGYPGDRSCGEDDNDGDGEPDRRPAPDNNAWGKYVC
jgi:hypothetical protein